MTSKRPKARQTNAGANLFSWPNHSTLAGPATERQRTTTPLSTIRLAELGTPRDRAQAEPHASFGGRGRSERDASPTQKGAIGFIGEVIANAWLWYQYDQRTVHWVSEYANLDGGTAGSDSVGYDFQVTT